MTTSTHRPRPAHARRGRVVFALLLAPLAVGCSAILPACDRAPAVVPGPTHTVRAKVVGLPAEGDPSSAFTLFHEDINEWLRPDGTKGMHAMMMPFPLAKGVALDGILVGDKVEVSVRQYKTGPIPYEVLAIRKLPSDTALTLPEEQTPHGR